MNSFNSDEGILCTISIISKTKLITSESLNVDVYYIVLLNKCLMFNISNTKFIVNYNRSLLFNILDLFIFIKLIISFLTEIWLNKFCRTCPVHNDFNYPNNPLVYNYMDLLGSNQVWKWWVMRNNIIIVGYII